jgi:hypothetical protein
MLREAKRFRPHPHPQIGSCAALLAFIFGLIPHRLSFLVAAVCASIASLGLLMYVSMILPLDPDSSPLTFGRMEISHSGAAIWTAIIKKDAFVNIVRVENGGSLGIYVTAGPALCEYHHSIRSNPRRSLTWPPAPRRGPLLTPSQTSLG